MGRAGALTSIGQHSSQTFHKDRIAPVPARRCIAVPAFIPRSSFSYIYGNTVKITDLNTEPLDQSEAEKYQKEVEDREKEAAAKAVAEHRAGDELPPANDHLPKPKTETKPKQVNFLYWKSRGRMVDFDDKSVAIGHCAPDGGAWSSCVLCMFLPSRGAV